MHRTPMSTRRQAIGLALAAGLARPDLAPAVGRARPDGLAELGHDREGERAGRGARSRLGGKTGVGALAAGGWSVLTVNWPK